jgi:hypothetical protein
MESTATPDSRPFDVADERAGAARDDLKALRGLRTRIEGVVAEIDRLRAENAALAQRVAGLEGSGQTALPLPVVPAGEDMRERLDAFIAAIDQALREADGQAATS